MKEIDKESRTCKMRDVMLVFDELDEIIQDFDAFDDKELIRQRKTMEKRANKALEYLNSACNISDEDVQYWLED